MRGGVCTSVGVVLYVLDRNIWVSTWTTNWTEPGPDSSTSVVPCCLVNLKLASSYVWEKKKGCATWTCTMGGNGSLEGSNLQQHFGNKEQRHFEFRLHHDHHATLQNNKWVARKMFWWKIQDMRNMENDSLTITQTVPPHVKSKFLKKTDFCFSHL